MIVVAEQQEPLALGLTCRAVAGPGKTDKCLAIRGRLGFSKCFVMLAAQTKSWMAVLEHALWVAMIEKNARVYLGTSFRSERRAVVISSRGFGGPVSPRAGRGIR